ncbi:MULTISPECIES: helix-turn-helix domain-containing protein [unclassified Chelatococcus]|uniref:helix-turn-helix domain-containing protein n=1 Tax=unclassified Chelatococcus TaxID=2638111 RepID=UPI001BD14515|nr:MULTISPECIES: helix-turn-helix domain-containing protein [unclassified Chelatococcus]MBS7697840.1 hypothetical protein [Chelatococcus sp. YT9]MBX3559805.1 hypothetical protein [Chelatococcus sp.]
MTPAVQEVVRETAASMRVPAHIILSPSRSRAAVSARHETIRRLRHDCAMAVSEIGAALGLDHTTVVYALNKQRNKSANVSHLKAVARDFVEHPKQLRWLFNGLHTSLKAPHILRHLRTLRSYELQRIPHERRREPNARRVPAEQRIDDIDAAILAARYVRRFGDGH